VLSDFITEKEFKQELKEHNIVIIVCRAEEYQKKEDM
jgi:hypothetical protein